MEKRAKNGSEGSGRAGFRVHGQDGCHFKADIGRSEVSLAGIWRSRFQTESQANTQALDRSGLAFPENTKEASGWKCRAQGSDGSRSQMAL